MQKIKDPFIGTTVGSQYRIIEKIGEGPKGIVYKARQVKQKKIVALKFVRPEFSRGEDFLDRFVREVRIAGQILNPNVLRVFDAGDSEHGFFYWVREYIDGENLEEIIFNHPEGMPFEAVHLIGVQICKALIAIHEEGIVHGNLKPQNVLLAHDADKASNVRISDFGILNSADDIALQHIQEGQTGPSFWAPEQRNSGIAGDRRSDVYSLGLLVYAMVVGHHPLAPHTNEVQGDLFQEEMLLSPALYRDGIPERLEAVINKAIEQLPDKRFQTVEAFLEEFEKCLDYRGGSRIDWDPAHRQPGEVMPTAPETPPEEPEVQSEDFPTEPEPPEEDMVDQPTEAPDHFFEPTAEEDEPRGHFHGTISPFSSRVWIISAAALLLLAAAAWFFWRSDNAQYTRLRQAGDSLFVLGKFEEARQVFEAALRQKPDDHYAAEKIDLSLENLQVRRNAEYQLYRNIGDSLLAAGELEEAARNFDEALARKPGDAYVASQRKATETRLASNRSSGNRAAEYRRYRAAGDELFAKKQYVAARSQYRRAATYQPNDSYLVARIRECDQEISKLKKGPQSGTSSPEDFQHQPDNSPIVPFYALTEKPKEIARVMPKYPQEALRERVEGTVVLKILVNSYGEIEEIQVLNSIPYLDEAAMAAARQFKFTPARQGNKPVKAWINVPVSFKLNPR